MMKSFAILSFVLLALSYNTAFAQSIGVLLGFGKMIRSEEYSMAEYQTYWLKIVKNKVELMGPIKDLLVPGAKGFLHVGTKSGCFREDDVDPKIDLFISPIDKKPVADVHDCKIAMKNAEIEKKKMSAEDLQCLSCDTTVATSEDSYAITFVSPKVVSIYHVNDYWGGVHPDRSYENQIMPLDKNKNDSMLGNFSELNWEREADEAMKDEECKGKDDEGKYRFNWMVVRKDFKWVIEVFVNTHRLCGYGREFYSKLILPEEEVGQTVPEKLVKQFSKKKELLVSSDKKYLITFEDQSLEVFNLDSDKVGASIGTAKLPVGNLVMSEWATGSYVSNWEKVFKDLQSKPWPEADYQKTKPTNSKTK